MNSTLINLVSENNLDHLKVFVEENNIIFENENAFLSIKEAFNQENIEIIEYIYNHPTFQKNDFWFESSTDIFVELCLSENIFLIDYILNNLDIDFEFNNFIIFVLLWDNKKIKSLKFLLSNNKFKNIITKDWLKEQYFTFGENEINFLNFIKFEDF